MRHTDTHSHTQTYNTDPFSVCRLLVPAVWQQDMTTEDKVRLFICYCATHPEKLDAEKMDKWMKAARLSKHDMMTVTNICMLGVNVFPPGA